VNNEYKYKYASHFKLSTATSDLDVKITKPYFDFKDGDLFLKIDKLEVFNIGSVPNSNPLGGQKSLVVAVDNCNFKRKLLIISSD
jgi:hypothetical protein